MVPLSKVLESMMRLTASGMSAERSMNEGPLPGPTPSAGLPELYAACTMAEPPVARMMPVSLLDMSSLVACMVVVSMTPMRPAGAPAFAAASCTTRTAAVVHFLAPGWGLTMMALPALSEMSDLYITVEVGFVDGMIAATMPMGTAISRILFSRSSLMTPIVFMSLMYS